MGVLVMTKISFGYAVSVMNQIKAQIHFLDLAAESGGAYDMQIFVGCIEVWIPLITPRIKTINRNP